MSKIQKVLFTGKTHTKFSGTGSPSHGHDGTLDIELSWPGNGDKLKHVYPAIVRHPTSEQMLAGAWSACFITAIGIVARDINVQLEPGLAVDIEVDLGMAGAEFYLQARIDVKVPGVTQEVADTIVHAADKMCPYSKAVHGNIDVALNIHTA
ncbi:peroxiredoxin [Pseudomonas sp. RIT-PI-q]|uniref:Ohr family peroxiredoxin n=1 Tax=Pseudomonas sp. RIT-PI-q TaxID=1690247 RepID=UPI0006CD4BB6|nr:Ohr family peroxiredoxin [Pseudomonas sp. RIT-PI-q]KPG96005.1 peroxiredoxin [Pseudomonas sp. RIT-PI-q]